MTSAATSNSPPSPASATDLEIVGDDVSAAASLSLDQLRRLCQAIAVDAGLFFVGAQRYGRYYDLLFTSTVLLHPRHVLVRVATEPPSGAMLEALAGEAVDRGCADFLLISTKPGLDPAMANSEHVLGPAAFVDLCRRSPMVEWRDRRPTTHIGAYRAAQRRARHLKELDSFGLSWLPALSRNRLPWVLRDSTITADEWFERVTFRLATSVFRANGVRFGTASRGRRVGDALLWWRGRLALLDCKAAQNGYKLGVDDERRLLDYARARYPGYGDSDTVDCVVLVSSGFPTFEADRQRFDNRRARFRDAGSDLACVRADDLVDSALVLLGGDGDTRFVDSICWPRILADGLVQRERLLTSCTTARRHR